MANYLPQIAPELAALVAQLTQEQAKRKWAEMRVTQLEEILRLLRLKKYGPQSESMADVYLPLFDDEPGVSLDEVAAEAGHAPLCRSRHRAKNGRNIPADSRCPPICRASSKSSLAPRRSANAGNAGPKRSSSDTKRVSGLM